MINLEELDRQAPQGAYSTLDQEVSVPEIQKIPEGGVYLEVGVDKGKSLWIARQVAKPSVAVCGVDINNLNIKIEGAQYYWADSVGLAERWTEGGGGPIDVLFIDGDHTYEGCKRDIDAWYPHMKEHGVMLFHDCDESSPGVVQAVFEFFNNLPKDSGAGIFLYKYNNKNTSMCKIQL